MVPLLQIVIIYYKSDANLNGLHWSWLIFHYREHVLRRPKPISVCPQIHTRIWTLRVASSGAQTKNPSSTKLNAKVELRRSKALTDAFSILFTLSKLSRLFQVRDFLSNYI